MSAAPRIAVTVAVLLSSAVASAKPPAPAVARKDDVVDRLHGVDVADPYRWLEDADARRGAALDRRAERRHAAGARSGPRPGGAGEAVLAALRDRFGRRARSRARCKAGGRRYFYTRRDGKQNQPVLYVRDGADGADRALVDVNGERADGTRALDWWFPSDDGALVAYGVSDDGSEESTLRVRDVATGKDLRRRRSRARAPARWPGRPTARGFYYTRYPAPGEVPADEMKYHRAVFHHRLGDDPAKDRKLFGDGRDMTDWPGVDLSPDGRWLAITVSQGWSKSEVYVADVRGGRRAGRRRRGRAGEVQRRRDARRSALPVHDQRRAARAALSRSIPRVPSARAGSELIKESGEVLQNVVYFRGGLAAASLQDAALRLRLYSADGAPRGDIAAAGAGRAHRADRRARRRRGLLRVHLVLRRRPRCSASTWPRRRPPRRRGGGCRRRSTARLTRSNG